MVFQHFQLADNLTVLENVVLGAEKLHGIGDAARAKIREISDAYGLEVPPDALVADLGVGARQRIEILKVLYRGARIIILDEPTAVLVPQEVDELFDNLRELKSEGLTVMFISHKLDEVLKVADAITVIRRGTTVAAVDPSRSTARQLAELMVGSELPSPVDRGVDGHRPPMLTIEDTSLADPPGGRRCSRTSSFDHPRRRGRSASPASRATARPSSSRSSWACASPSGRILLGDVDISDWQVREIREAGIGYIPEDRHRHGLLLEAPLWENRILGHQTEAPNVGGGLVDAARRQARDPERSSSEYDVRTPSINVTPGSLSGGNQQKLIIGREMRRSRWCSSRRTRPAASTSARRPRSGTTSGRPGARPRGPAHLGRPRGAGRPVRHGSR